MVATASFYVDSVNVSDKEVKEYVKKHYSTESTILSKSADAKNNKVVYTLQNDKDLTFNVEVSKAGNKEKITRDSYINKTIQRDAEEAISKLLPKIEEYGFKPMEEYIVVGADGYHTKPIKLSFKYKDDLTIFDLDEEAYQNIFSLLEEVKGANISNIYLHLEGVTSGGMVLADLDKLTSIEDIENVITKSVQEQMGGK